MRFVYGGGATHSRAREVKRVRRISLNRIRSQGGLHLFNGIRLRVRCDALAQSTRNPREGFEGRPTSARRVSEVPVRVSSEAWQRKRRSLRVGMRVRRTFLNGIRSQGGFYLVNEICLRGRCDAFAHGRDLRDADNVRAAGLSSEAWQRKTRSLRDMRVRRTFLNGIRSQGWILSG